MREVALLAAAAAGAGLVSCLGTRALIPLLHRRAVLDRPNERSLHAVPVPRGGGIAVVGAIVLAWLALSLGRGLALNIPAVLLGTLLLAIVSWRDDVGGLPPAVRLVAQAAAVGLALGVVILTSTGTVFHSWLPRSFDI